jgi:glutamate N-acetyltransferase / amino-acid N-acetyltransferase
LKCSADEIFLASTGVIGVCLPDKKVRDFLPDAITRLSNGGVEALSHAILTTDIGPKVAQASFTIGGKRARIVGVAKGAGMIHPNMATMLGFVMTDAAVSSKDLQRLLKEAVDESFNAISVDGDTSTNDTVLVLASGAAGNSEDADLAGFEKALTTICRDLAWMIVRDGEGATRVMELEVNGAKTDRDAKLAAHAIATSPLVKTALHGRDANWGRVLAAAGSAPFNGGYARLDPSLVTLDFDGVRVLELGVPRGVEPELAGEAVTIDLDLGLGAGSASYLTSDLSSEYVRINADYRS